MGGRGNHLAVWKENQSKKHNIVVQNRQLVFVVARESWSIKGDKAYDK